MSSPSAFRCKVLSARSYIAAPVQAEAPREVTERGQRFFEYVRLPSTQTPLFVAEIGSPATEAEEERRYVFSGFPALVRGSVVMNLRRMQIFTFVPVRTHRIVARDYFMQVRRIYVSADGAQFTYMTESGLALIEPVVAGSVVSLTGMSLVFRDDRIVHGWHEHYM